MRFVPKADAVLQCSCACVKLQRSTICIFERRFGIAQSIKHALALKNLMLTASMQPPPPNFRGQLQPDFREGWDSESGA